MVLGHLVGGSFVLHILDLLVLGTLVGASFGFGIFQNSLMSFLLLRCCFYLVKITT